jgi:hypothetical protein
MKAKSKNLIDNIWKWSFCTKSFPCTDLGSHNIVKPPKAPLPSICIDFHLVHFLIVLS